MSCALHRLRSLGKLLSRVIASDGHSLVNHSHTAAAIEKAQVRPRMMHWLPQIVIESLHWQCNGLCFMSTCRGQEWLLELQPARNCFTRDS